MEIGAEDLTAQFVAGRIKAVVLYEPWAASAQRKTGADILATSADYTGCIPEGLWAYRERLNKIPPPDIEKLLKGWVDAAIWINNPANWKKFTIILNKRTFGGYKKYDDAELKSMFENVRIHDLDFLFERNRNRGGMEEYLEDLKRFLNNNGLLTKSFNPKDIFDNRHILKVLKDYRN